MERQSLESVHHSPTVPAGRNKPAHAPYDGCRTQSAAHIKTQVTGVSSRVEVVLPGPEHRNRRYQAVLLDFCAATKEVYVYFSNALTPSFLAGSKQLPEEATSRIGEPSSSTPLATGLPVAEYNGPLSQGGQGHATTSQELQKDVKSTGMLRESLERESDLDSRVRPQALPSRESSSEAVQSVATGEGQERGQNSAISLHTPYESALLDSADERLEHLFDGVTRRHTESTDEGRSETECTEKGQPAKPLPKRKSVSFRPMWLPAAAVFFAGLTHSRSSDNTVCSLGPCSNRRQQTRSLLGCGDDQVLLSQKSIVEVFRPSTLRVPAHYALGTVLPLPTRPVVDQARQRSPGQCGFDVVPCDQEASAERESLAYVRLLSSPSVKVHVPKAFLRVPRHTHTATNCSPSGHDAFISRSRSEEFSFLPPDFFTPLRRLGSDGSLRAAGPFGPFNLAAGRKSSSHGHTPTGHLQQAVTQSQFVRPENPEEQVDTSLEALSGTPLTSLLPILCRQAVSLPWEVARRFGTVLNAPPDNPDEPCVATTSDEGTPLDAQTILQILEQEADDETVALLRFLRGERYDASGIFPKTADRSPASANNTNRRLQGLLAVTLILEKKSKKGLFAPATTASGATTTEKLSRSASLHQETEGLSVKNANTPDDASGANVSRDTWPKRESTLNVPASPVSKVTNERHRHELIEQAQVNHQQDEPLQARHLADPPQHEPSVVSPLAAGELVINGAAQMEREFGDENLAGQDITGTLCPYFRKTREGVCRIFPRGKPGIPASPGGSRDCRQSRTEEDLGLSQETNQAVTITDGEKQDEPRTEQTAACMLARHKAAEDSGQNRGQRDLDLSNDDEAAGFFASLVASPADAHLEEEDEPGLTGRIVILGTILEVVDRLKTSLKASGKWMSQVLLFRERREKRLKWLVASCISSFCLEFKAKETVGLIIGKQGERLEKLAKQYQVEIRVFPQEENSTTRRVRIYGSTRQSVEEAFSELQYVSAVYSLRPPETSASEKTSGTPAGTVGDSILPDPRSSVFVATEVAADTPSAYRALTGNSFLDTTTSLPLGPHNAPKNAAPGQVSEGKGMTVPCEHAQGLPVWIQPAGEDEHETLSKFGFTKTYYAPIGSYRSSGTASRVFGTGEDHRRQTKTGTSQTFCTTLSREQQVDLVMTELRRRATVLRQIIAASGLLGAWLDEKNQCLTLYGLRRSISAAVDLLDEYVRRLFEQPRPAGESIESPLLSSPRRIQQPLLRQSRVRPPHDVTSASRPMSPCPLLPTPPPVLNTPPVTAHLPSLPDSFSACSLSSSSSILGSVLASQSHKTHSMIPGTIRTPCPFPTFPSALSSPPSIAALWPATPSCTGAAPDATLSEPKDR
ncbi:kh domain protein [Cystoisospora suis]|uniref:Kh domain protein n=1 Tax=Cystoisospora suis TaxID=483139 RepID=A0A2C6L008_9APIC|nr:kh domain protein [Cystoisospora suis]